MVDPYETQPCEFYDRETLIYFAKTDRDGLAKVARQEWKKRYGAEYPKEGQNEISNLFQTQ